MSTKFQLFARRVVDRIKTRRGAGGGLSVCPGHQAAGDGIAFRRVASPTRRLNLATVAGRAGMALAVLAFGALAAACGSSGGSKAAATSSGPTTTTAHTTQASHTTKASQVKVALLTTAPAHDKAWGQAVSQGGQDAHKKYGVQVSFDGTLTTTAEYLKAGEAYISKGYKFIDVATGAAPTPTLQLAKAHPTVFICELPINIPNPPSNVCTTQPEYYVGDFLVGALSAMVSKSKVLGTISGGNFPAVNWQVNAFGLGARWIDPTIKIINTTMSGLASFNTVAQARNAAEVQASDGVDVYFAVLNSAVEGVMAVCKAHPGTYVIPSGLNDHAEGPGVVLTSVQFDLTGAITKEIGRYVNHTIKNKHYIVSYKTGAGKLAPYYTMYPKVVTPKIKSRIEKITEMLTSGKISVPTLIKLGQTKTYTLSSFPSPPK